MSSQIFKSNEMENVFLKHALAMFFGFEPVIPSSSSFTKENIKLKKKFSITRIFSFKIQQNPPIPVVKNIET